jgi:hypothetical protein
MWVEIISLSLLFWSADLKPADWNKGSIIKTNLNGEIYRKGKSSN